MDDSLTAYFKKIEALKTLRFAHIKVLETNSQGEDDLIRARQEYDEFSGAQARLLRNFARISTNNLPLTIGIVGSFNTGKSSLINSLIGSRFLVMADKSSTRKITVLIHKDANTFQIFQFNNDGHATEISYEDYLLAGAHQHREALASEPLDEISYFEVYFPSPALKDFQIVDTPGFSSMSAQDDRITREYLGKADLLLWTFDAGKGAIDAIEIELLQSITDKRIIAVINRIDDLAPAQRERVIRNIAEAYPFYRVVPYSAVNVLTYQEDVVFNSETRNRVLKNLGRRLDAGASTTVSNNNGVLTLTNGDDVIYEQALRPIDEDDEFVFQYDALRALLQEIREEVSKIKMEQLIEEIKSFQDRESVYWAMHAGKLLDTMERYTEKQHALEEVVKSTKDLIESRAEIYYGELKEEICGKVFDMLYTFDYKSAGLFEGEKYILTKLPDNEDSRQALFGLIQGAFDTFYDNLVADYKDALCETDIDVTENEWLGFSGTLKDQFAESSFYSIVGARLLVVDFETGQTPSEIRQIFNESLELLMSHAYVHHFTKAFLEYIAEDLLEKRKSEYAGRYATLRDFNETIITVLNGKHN